MDNYTSQIVRGQRIGAAACVVTALSMLALVAFHPGRSGPIGALLLAWLLLGLALPTAISRRNRRRECRRRRDGAIPGWPAQLPTRYAHRAGNSRSGNDGNGCLAGRLSHTDGVFTWEPSPRSARNLKATPRHWDTTWTANLVRSIPWLGQGVLTLRAPNGDAVHLRVRNCDALLDQLCRTRNPTLTS